ncbi:MAG: DNA replication and repair protein RecF [Paludibacteraceae bacterium]|nr:DNA replication and repair protein RecF [Paludibacteraceae bacterium]
MFLRNLTILNFKNIREANLQFAEKLNCFVGLNGQGKTNLLDAIYYLSFTKSAFNAVDSQNITHNEQFCMLQGEYQSDSTGADEQLQVSCGIRRGQKKQFRCGKKDYQRLHDHIGKLPLVMVSPADQEMINDGSEARRKFIDGVISQYSRNYLDTLTRYQTLLKQRNILLRQCDEQPDRLQSDLMDILEEQMAACDEVIFAERTAFIQAFIPIFQTVYTTISGDAEQVSLSYVSQLQSRDMKQSLRDTRQRDVYLGWTSQGVHKDDMEMLLDEHPLRQVASQGQQKTFTLALKLAQALYLAGGENNIPSAKPILLLDDIFDKLDTHRVENIINLVHSDAFGQIFLTDTDRQHLTSLLAPHRTDSRLFHVCNGEIELMTN